MRFLHSTSGWGTLPGGLGSQLLPWSLSSGGFTGSLFGTGHVAVAKYKYIKKITDYNSWLLWHRPSSECRASKKELRPAFDIMPPRINQSFGNGIMRFIIIDFRNIKIVRVKEWGKVNSKDPTAFRCCPNRQRDSGHLTPVQTIRTYSFCYSPFSKAASTGFRSDIRSVHLKYSFDTFTNGSISLVR